MNEIADRAEAASHGSGSHSSGGHGYSPAMLAFFARRLLVTEHMMKMYAAGLCGLIGIFVVFHWTRWLFVKLGRVWRPILVLEAPFVALSRFGRNLLVRKVPGFKSAGHALLTAAFVAINGAVAFTNVEQNSMPNFACRFGWMALANMCFLVLLALKNTPLAFLTAYSYERLNCLHQIAGYTMFTFLVLHAALYTAYFDSQGRLLSKYAERAEVAAIISGFSFLSVILSAVFLRRWWYELFYVVHISSWIMAIVSLGFHQPEFSKKALIVVVLAGSLWVCDRIIRATRVLYYSINNEATLHPLPNGGTKIVFKKAPGRAEPGKHCFVWIPAVRRFETHPFTIHKTDPVEFTVKAHNGFTADLHKYAVANPGRPVTASLDGPYGTFPDPMGFDKIVLIAGGGGATFTFGLVVNVLERMREETHKNVVFIWAVKKHENLSWFKEHLEVLKTHAHSSKINVSLYVTRAPVSPTHHHHHLSHLHRRDEPTSPVSRSSQSDESDEARSTNLSPVDPEKGTGTSMPQPPSPVHHHSSTQSQPQPLTSNPLSEKELERGTTNEHVEHICLGEDAPGKEAMLTATSSSSSHGYEHAIKPGRPDMASLIRSAVESAPSNQRVLVAACGPDGLMRVVRTTTARLIRGDGPAVELHCEQFGW